MLSVARGGAGERPTNPKVMALSALDVHPGTAGAVAGGKRPRGELAAGGVLAAASAPWSESLWMPDLERRVNCPESGMVGKSNTPLQDASGGAH